METETTHHSTSQEAFPVVKFKYKKQLITGIVCLVAVLVSFGGGLALGNKGYAFNNKNYTIVNTTEQGTEVDYSLLWQAVAKVKEKFIDKDHIDDKKIMYGAVKGAVNAAGDQYTDFFDPESFDQFKTDLAGSFDGIGAEIGKKNGALVIIAPIEDAPAQKAGLRAGDFIVKIDGGTASDLSVEEAVHKIRGKKGTPVVLTIVREGDTAPRDITIIRDKISIKSVKLEYKESHGQQIAWLKLTRFGDDTKDLFDKAVSDMQGKGVKYMVLDMRNNPGGYLDTAVDLASNWFKKDDLIVSEHHSDGSIKEYRSFGYGKLSDVKTIVLVNNGSASASEILSGALQDGHFSKLVGIQTYGKGSVQELIPLPQNSAVKVTIARWFTPAGKNIDKGGLAVDVEVKPGDDDFKDKDHPKDTQLEKAMEELFK